MKTEEKCSINETYLRKLVSDIVDEYFRHIDNSLLLEMAMERKVFKERVDNLLPQIIENWCLIYYSRITNTNTQVIDHWKNELNTHISAIISFQMTKNNSIQTRAKVIQELWKEFDYDKSETISIIVRSKFLKEKLNVKSNEYFETSEQFVNYSDDLIKVLSEYGNVEQVDKYVDKL